MKFLSKADSQIAASQYAAGFTFRIAQPGGQPEARGSGAKFYLEGYADAIVAPRSNLKDKVLSGDADADNKLFSALTYDCDESEAGRPFVCELRKIAAGIVTDAGDDPKNVVPHIYRALMSGAEAIIEKQAEQARASAVVDELVARGLVIKP